MEKSTPGQKPIYLCCGVRIQDSCEDNLSPGVSLCTQVAVTQPLPLPPQAVWKRVIRLIATLPSAD